MIKIRLLFLIGLLINSIVLLGNTYASGDMDGTIFAARSAVDTWNTEVEGMKITYRMVAGTEKDTIAGVTVIWLDRCIITLNNYIISSENFIFNRDYLVFVASHEIGHCVDRLKLNYNHNGFTDEGCRFGSYFCKPPEGFAEAFSYNYVAKCGMATSPLGLKYYRDDVECELPDENKVLSVTLEAMP